MGKAVFSNIVKSSLTSKLTDLVWFGAPVGASAQWDDQLTNSSGIGIGSLDRVWVDRPNILQLSVSTMLGDSAQLAVHEGTRFDLLADYVLPLLGTQGYFSPAPNQSVLTDIELNFTANQVCTGTFNHTIFRPTSDLIEWFDLYQSEDEIPWGTGEQFAALGTGDVKITHGEQRLAIDGISSLSVSAPLQVDRIETIYKAGLFIPRLPLEIGVRVEIMNDYFIHNEEIFSRIDQLSSLAVWKFTLTAPKIINVEQSNQSGAPRSWSVSMQAKNLIKEI